MGGKYICQIKFYHHVPAIALPVLYSPILNNLLSLNKNFHFDRNLGTSEFLVVKTF